MAQQVTETETKRDADVTEISPGNVRGTSGAVPPEAGGGCSAGGLLTKCHRLGNICNLKAYSLRLARECAEVAAIEGALEFAVGNVTLAAWILKISRRGLYRRIRKYGIRRKEWSV